MNIQTSWLSIYIAVMGIVISGLLAYLSYSLNRQSQRAAIQRSIQDLYDNMIKYRTEHPEVMKLCYRWNSDSFTAAYRQSTATDRTWAIYYNYAELVSGFSNAVLYGRKARLLDNLAYTQHYKPLVTLLITEHYPYFSDVISGPYVSSFIKDFMQDLEKDGWNWIERRKALIGPALLKGHENP